MSAAANATPVGADGSADLARAARSLESVQGNVSGQTLAIQQMTMASQQQAVNLQLLITQLGNQVSTLSHALSQLSTGVQMSAAMSGMSAPAPAMHAGSSFGPQVMGGAAMAGRGLMTGAGVMSAFGAPFGRLGSALAAPFFGAPVFGPAPGTVAPRMSPDVGFMRSLGMATGLGIQPEMMRQAGASQIHELGREHLQQRFGDMFMGTTGGAARFGGMLLGEAGGGAMASAMGLRGLTGFAAGTLLGLPISAALGAGINETMGQAASIRGFGDQFARNAFRFMPQSSMGMQNLRRPDMRQRNRFGQAANRMAIDDLTFNDQDMTEMFAGMSQQDLLRGVQNVDEVVEKFRHTKETFKLIGRRMGQGLQEAAGTMSALQDLGFDPTSTRGRTAVFGASSVMGRSPTEAMGRGLAFGQQFAGQGFGREMFNVGLLSQQMGQSAIANGALNSVDIAALGGREGVGDAMGNLMGQFLNSSLGQATLLAGPGGRGMGVHQTMGLAGNRASTDINRLINIQMGGEEEIRQFLSSPIEAKVRIFELVSDLARVYEQGGASRSNAMRTALKQIAPGLNGAQLTAILKEFQNLPKATAESQMLMAGQAGAEIDDTAMEQMAIMARTKRALKGAFTPAAETLADGATDLGTRLGNLTNEAFRGLTGTESMNMGAGLDTATLSALRGRSGGGVIEEREMAVVGSDMQQMRAMQHNARIRIRRRQRSEQEAINKASLNDRVLTMADKMAGAALATNSSKIDKIKKKIQDPNTDQDEKRALMEELMSIVSQDTYSGAPNSAKRAFQAAVEKRLGLDPAAIFGGREFKSSFSGADREKLKDLREDMASLLGVSEDEAAGFARPEIQALVEAIQGGGDVEAARERAIDAGLQNQVDRIQELSESKFMDFRLGAWSSEDQIFGFATGRDRLDAFARRLKGDGGAIALERLEAGQNRLKTLGQVSSNMLRQLRRRGKGMGTAGVGVGLRSGDASAILSNFDQLIGTLGKDEDALKELDSGEIAGGKRMVEVVRALRGIDLSDDEGRLTDGEKSRIASLLNITDSKAMDELAKEVQDARSLGTVVAQAIDGQTPQNMQVTTKKGGEFTDQQIGLMQQMLADQRELTRMIAEMSKNPVFRKGN